MLRHILIPKRLASNFITSPENPKHSKKTIGLQFYLTILRRVTILYNNQIYYNEKKYVFKDLNEVPQKDYWFPYKYIDAAVNTKLDKTK